MPVTKTALIKKLELGLDPTILNEFLSSSRPEDQEWKPIVQEVKDLWDTGGITVVRCYCCKTTGNGKEGFFLAGSLGTLCSDCYDREEDKL